MLLTIPARELVKKSNTIKSGYLTKVRAIETEQACGSLVVIILISFSLFFFSFDTTARRNYEELEKEILCSSRNAPLLLRKRKGFVACLTAFF